MVQKRLLAWMAALATAWGLSSAAHAQDAGTTSEEEADTMTFGTESESGSGSGTGSGSSSDFGSSSTGTGTATEGATTAASGDHVMPMAMAERGLTIPAGTVRGDANFTVFEQLGFQDVGASMSIGGAVGIIENLHAGIRLLPIVFAPDAGYGDMRMFGQYRFVDMDLIEVAGRLEMVLPTNSTNIFSTDFSLSFGAPVRLHLTDSMRIDTGIEFSLAVIDRSVPGPGPDPGRDTLFGLSAPQGLPGDRHVAADRSAAGIPVVFNYSITENIFAGARTGFGIEDFTDGNAGDTVFVPLGFQGGYTIAGDQGPLVDITGRFRWPRLYRKTANDNAHPDVYEVMVSGEVYLHQLF